MSATFGGFTTSLSGLVGSEFVRWFALEAGEKGATPGTTVFRPSGPAFQDLVRLEADSDPVGVIQRLTLVVTRRFLEDDQRGAFARDIVKSFLETLGAIGPDGARLAPLIQEVMWRDPPSPVIAAPPAPALAAEPSPAFRVLVGAAPACRVQLRSGTLSFTNDIIDRDRCLSITIERNAVAGHSLLKKFSALFRSFSPSQAKH